MVKEFCVILGSIKQKLKKVITENASSGAVSKKLSIDRRNCDDDDLCRDRF